jgi:hypothetical protein
MPNRSDCVIHRLRLCICPAAAGSRECERPLQSQDFSTIGVRVIRTAASHQALNTILDHGCQICSLHRNAPTDHFLQFPERYQTSRVLSAELFLALCKQETHCDHVKVGRVMKRGSDDQRTGRHQRVVHDCVAKTHLRAPRGDKLVSHQRS